MYILIQAAADPQSHSEAAGERGGGERGAEQMKRLEHRQRSAAEGRGESGAARIGDLVVGEEIQVLERRDPAFGRRGQQSWSYGK